MDQFLGLTATGWTAIYTFLTLGLLVTAIAAARYAHAQWRVARVQMDDARLAEREASRPYVIVTIESWPSDRSIFDLAVANIGRRPALGVSVRLDPPPARARETEGVEIAKVKMLTEPIAMLAPGQSIRSFYDDHAERGGVEGLPVLHRVYLAYQDSSGVEYREESVLDLEAERGSLFVQEKTLHHLVQSVEAIRLTLRGASVLARNGTVSVDAAVEPRSERERREADELQARRVSALDIIKAATPDDPMVAELEKKVAEGDAGLSVGHDD